MAAYGIVLLAAGSSSRMGSPKQLLNYGGKPLLRHAVEVALASVCKPVFVVLGSQSEQIGGALDGLPVELLRNEQWEGGMGTSIHAGVQAAEAQNLDGVILALGDQPLITAAILNRLVATHQATGQPIVTAQYSGTVGVPVFFSREFFPHLLALEPSQGCKGIILSHGGRTVRVEVPEAATDIDTPNDCAAVGIQA